MMRMLTDDVVAKVDGRAGLRRRVERLSHWAKHLPPGDRALLDHVLQQGRPLREIADLSGMSPRRVRERTEKVARRLQSREFQFVVGFGSKRLPAEYLPIARACFVQGLSLRAAAEQTGTSVHRVRLIRRCVHEIIRVSKF